MNLNEKQTPQAQPEALSQVQPQQIQAWPVMNDDEDDPVATEGYLPEIYFSLKSENPADW